jgi:hypothetical protein
MKHRQRPSYILIFALTGRDDRVISSTGRESRIPYLDEVPSSSSPGVVVSN